MEGSLSDMLWSLTQDVSTILIPTGDQEIETEILNKLPQVVQLPSSSFSPRKSKTRGLGVD